MRGFRRIAVAAASATFLLIAVGGFVRAAGAGLGCPDWPRCFGRWIPPTDASQLPPEIDPARFDFALAWIEYVNRLLGMVVGLLIVAVLVSAWHVHRRRPAIVVPAAVTALLVAFQGWFGGQVVAHELDPRLVTVHLFVALAIVGLLLHLVVQGFDAGGGRLPRPPAGAAPLFRVALVVLGAAVVQVMLGAFLRGGLEGVVAAEPDLERARLLGRIGAADEVHKTGALVVVLLCAWLLWQAHVRLPESPALRRLLQAPAWLTLAQIAAGLGLTSLALPPVLQLAHLVLGSLLFGCLVLSVLLLAPGRASPPGDPQSCSRPGWA